eukprot:1777356-Rhodomonas_salina.1
MADESKIFGVKYMTVRAKLPWYTGTRAKMAAVPFQNGCTMVVCQQGQPGYTYKEVLSEFMAHYGQLLNPEPSLTPWSTDVSMGGFCLKEEVELTMPMVQLKQQTDLMGSSEFVGGRIKGMPLDNALAGGDSQVVTQIMHSV